MQFRLLKDAPIKKGTRVLIRADFDVAVKKGKVQEDFRIRGALPTIEFVLKRGGMIRIAAHLGRPGGKKDQSLSLKKIALHLSGLLKKKIVFLGDPFPEASFRKYNQCSDIILFENLRFWPGEEMNEQNFARGLSRWGDIYVNDAFANSHRRHASVAALARILPAFAGLSLEREVKALNKIQNPRKPFFAILGGAKLETKLPLIERFLKTADGVLLGGALANTFFLAKGLEIGRSLADGKAGGLARPSFAKQNLGGLANIDLGSKNLYLPQDVRVVSSFGSSVRLARPGDVGKKEAILDIGPKTVEYYDSLLHRAKTVVWNGPMGVAEKKEFSYGTVGIAKSLQKIKAFKVVGGGDTIAVLHKHKVLEGFSHISSGGGAMLAFLAGQRLPGLEALKKQ